MNIVQILKMFYKHIVLICTSIVIVTLLVIVKMFFFTTPTYVSSTQLIANNNTGMIGTYKQLITSDKFTSAINTSLIKNKLASSDEIGKVTVVYTPTSPIFEIDYTSSNPKVAVEGSNKATQLFVRNLGKYFAGNLVSVYSPANIPEKAGKTQLKKIIIISMISGFVIGCLFSLLVEIFSPSVKDVDYTQNVLGINNLGTVHLITREKRSR